MLPASIPPMANQGRPVPFARLADEAEPGEVVELLGRAGEDRADAEIPRPFQRRLLDLAPVVGRGAQEDRGADDPPGVAEGQVVLAEVDRVGPGEPGEVGPVVHHEPGLRLGGEDPDLARPRQQLAVGQAFLAELDRPGAAGQGLAHDPGQVAQGGQAADEDHQVDVVERPPGRGGRHRQLLQGVDVVAEHLEPAGDPDVEELAVFFERPERLGGPLEVGDQDGPGVLAGLLARGHDVGADVAPGVARADQDLGVEPPEGVGQAVADLLDPPGQHRVVEREPDVVLDHPEPFAGPVRRGVEDPAEVDALARLDQLQRGDLAGQGDRPGLGGLGPGQCGQQARGVEPGGGQRVHHRVARAEQAGQDVLGPDPAVDAGRLAPGRRVHQRRPGGGRERDRAVGPRPVGLVVREGGHPGGRGDGGGVEPELAQEGRGPAFRLVGQGVGEVDRLDLGRRPRQGPGLGPAEGPQGPGGERFKHGPPAPTR